VSSEGIECIILQGQFSGNLGRPRKGWTVIRKALSHAVLLGLHRPPSQAPTASSLHSQHRENIWWHLVQCDAYISLMLGLPSFMVPLLEPQTDLSTAVGVTSSEDYRRKLAILVGRIIQRNQVVPSQLPPRYEPQFKLMMNSTRSQPIWNLFRGIPLHHHWISASKMPS